MKILFAKIVKVSDHHALDGHSFAVVAVIAQNQVIFKKELTRFDKMIDAVEFLKMQPKGAYENYKG
jgi:hypothetical protein